MKRHTLLPALFAAVLLSAVACGDDTNDNPTPPDVSTGGSNPNAGSGNKAGSAGKGNGEGGAGNSSAGGAPEVTDGGEPTVDVGGQGQGGEGPIPEPECSLPERGKDGCYNCPKNGVVEQFLNRCTEGDILEFDNAARLPLLEADGSLPDLPN